MKKRLLLILIAFISINCYSQISYEKGYFINNSGQKKEGLIKNIDWNNNPDQFSFKSAEGAEEKTMTLESVKEFGIYDESKYIRSTVNIDRSSKILRELSEQKKPVFQKEQLFLKVLVEGKANLYLYEDGNILRYFFNKDDSAIEQLVYKKYKVSKTEIGENERFKQQLWNDLKCESISLNQVEKTDYISKELINLFINYNECEGTEFVNYENKDKKKVFHLTLRPGFNSTSLSVENSLSSSLNTDFGDKLNFRFGIEAEYLLPFNKNKWSVIIEPTYQYFNSSFSSSDRRVINRSIDYQSIEIPVGIRHYSFLNEKSKLFINGSFVFDISSNESMLNNNTEIKTGYNLAFGLGYKYDEKYSLEFRIFTNRDLFNNYQYYSSNYKTLSVILGYTLF